MSQLAARSKSVRVQSHGGRVYIRPCSCDSSTTDNKSAHRAEHPESSNAGFKQSSRSLKSTCSPHCREHSLKSSLPTDSKPTTIITFGASCFHDFESRRALSALAMEHLDPSSSRRPRILQQVAKVLHICTRLLALSSRVQGILPL
jgi:hypothetical protein